MFKKHPKGLIPAALSNMGERFGYYIMNAVLLLFLCSKFGLSDETSGVIYSVFYALIYVLSLLGGWIADRRQNYKGTIMSGLVVMAVGYALLSIPILSTSENINGNWRFGGNVSYRTDFKHANISVNSSYNYNHSVSYMQTLGATESGKGFSNVHSISLTPRFVLYTKHFDLTLNGSYRYQWGESNYMTSIEENHTYNVNSTWNYWLGNRLTLKTDLNISGQAGSKMRDANRTEFIWNMGVEYKVLRDYRGLLKLSWYDILHERSNFSTYITGTGRSESRSSGNPHYVQLTFQYKLYKMK